MSQKILLVDDHTIIRTGLKILMASDLPGYTFNDAEDGLKAMAMIQADKYSLIVLDVNIPGTDVFALVTQILTYDPSLAILMFSMNEEKIYAKKFYKLGVKGYVRKDEPAEEIKKAFQQVLQNRKYISKAYSESLAEQMFDKKTENPIELLSPKQVEIMHLLVKGRSVGEICSFMKLHSSTVSTQKIRIFEKLKVTNVVELYAFAKMNQLSIA